MSRVINYGEHCCWLNFRVQLMCHSIYSLGQVWVINSNFFLQLNLCVCYQENQFGLIVGPGRALLTLARSHICPVNKFVRKKSSLILKIVIFFTSFYDWEKNTNHLHSPHMGIYSRHSFSPRSCVTKTKYLNNSALLLKCVITFSSKITNFCK